MKFCDIINTTNLGFIFQIQKNKSKDNRHSNNDHLRITEQTRPICHVHSHPLQHDSMENITDIDDQNFENSSVNVSEQDLEAPEESSMINMRPMIRNYDRYRPSRLNNEALITRHQVQ